MICRVYSQYRGKVVQSGQGYGISFCHATQFTDSTLSHDDGNNKGNHILERTSWRVTRHELLDCKRSRVHCLQLEGRSRRVHKVTAWDFQISWLSTL